MAKALLISLPGYDALLETDPDHFAVKADEDNIIIKEKERGSGTLGLGSSATINHALAYIPFYLVYTLISAGRYRVSNGFASLSNGWQTYATTSDLVITNNYSATYGDYQYYVFHDNMN